jgi:hypothetical protein
MKRMSLFAALGIATMMAGCARDPAVNAGQVDWSSARQSDASCVDAVYTKNVGTYNLGGSADDEVFLLQRCRLATDRRGEQLEVVTGGEDPVATHPTKLVLQEPSEVVGLVKFCGPWAAYRVTRAGKSTLWHVAWKEDGTGLDKPVPGGAPCK